MSNASSLFNKELLWEKQLKESHAEKREGLIFSQEMIGNKIAPLLPNYTSRGCYPKAMSTRTNVLAMLKRISWPKSKLLMMEFSQNFKIISTSKMIKDPSKIKNSKLIIIYKVQ